MESAIRNHPFRNYSNDKSTLLQSEPYFESGPLLLLNQDLDKLKLPHVINESSIERFLEILENTGTCGHPCYWLLMARIFELALFCAGNYADNCEFSAAGDLLVNPRKVFIHRENYPRALLKQRHGRLSEQLNKSESYGTPFFTLLSDEVSVETAEPPILPYVFEQMQHSRKIAAWYLESAGKRMKKIADTIGFLSSWAASGFEDFHSRMREASTETCRFVCDHLCRFDTHYFERLGREIQKLTRNSNALCEFLVEQ